MEVLGFLAIVSGVLIITVTAFDCKSSGIFADPLDCTGYYSCDANLQASKGTCTSSGYFNAALKTCAIGTCTNPTTTVATKTFQCSSSGLFADPADCRSYYSCNYRLESARITCPLFTYFSTTYKDCEVGDCPATTAAPTVTTITAAPAVTTTTTATPATTTTTTAEPTTSPTTAAPTTTTTITTTTTSTTPTTTSTTTSPPSTTPTCTSSSQLFQYPSDCHKYYRCSANLQLELMTCGLGFFQHFDPATGQCVFGFC